MIPLTAQHATALGVAWLLTLVAAGYVARVSKRGQPSTAPDAAKRPSRPEPAPDEPSRPGHADLRRALDEIVAHANRVLERDLDTEQAELAAGIRRSGRTLLAGLEHDGDPITAELPPPSDAQRADDPARTARDNGAAGGPVLAERFVLIVDDNTPHRRVLFEVARAWGMQPRTAASADEALGWIRGSQRFDVVVVNLEHPTANPSALMAALRQHPNGRTLPIVRLVRSAHRNGEPPPAVTYLERPVRTGQLFDVLCDVVRTATTNAGRSRVLFDPTMAARHPLRLLVAEDNPVNQKVMRLMLRRLGYRADVVSNGREALDAARERPYDVILMDIQMPGMDGLSATRQLRLRHSAGARPYVVAVTAHSSDGERERYLNAGMDAVVPKPVRVADLVAALNQCDRIDYGDRVPRPSRGRRGAPPTVERHHVAS